MALPPTRAISYAEYLDIEAASLEKHEWFDGHVLAMAGGRPYHAALAARVLVQLGIQLQGRPCQPYGSDLRHRCPGDGLATYPDVSVICGPIAAHPEDRDAATNPTVLVEVLSQSTEGYDRGENFVHYARMESLRDYILVNWRQARIEHYWRDEDGRWIREWADAGAVISLRGVAASLDVDVIYEGIDLPQAERTVGSIAVASR